MESYSGINITRSFSLKTAIKIAWSWNFEAVTPDEILRDRLLFDIRDNKVRERLLRETGLTLRKPDEICRASESMQKQMKVQESIKGVPVSVLYSSGKGRKETSPKKEKFNLKAGFKGNRMDPKKCGNCGKQHDVNRNTGSAENYRILPSNKCRSSKRNRKEINAVDIESAEMMKYSRFQLSA